MQVSKVSFGLDVRFMVFSGTLEKWEKDLAHDTAELFVRIVERVRALDPVHTRKWFDDLVVARLDAGILEVACPNEAAAQFLEDNCLSVFTQAAQHATGHLVAIRFVVNQAAGATPSLAVDPSAVRLHPDYTFESFVVGPCNRLAHASCIAVSHSPGNTYNPLFVYGAVGLGKTHLLHAVCHGVRKDTPDIRIQFLSCEEFVNRFITAIEQGLLAEFQSQFRTVDVLVIDDVQFLSEREQSQEEFFHTFNAIYNNHRQIILTADCAPGEIPAIEERLISRFKWGLVARLDAPSYETRVAIVQKKARLRGIDIGDEVAEYIAGKVIANIRELEGALTIIYATAQAAGEPINLQLARQALGRQQAETRKGVSITEIIDAVTRFYDVRLADLQSKRRSQSIALPRQVCMYLARNLTRHSLEEIGGHLGGRDHSTVLHAYGKIDELRRTDPQTRGQIDQLIAAIRPE
ncbi:MAG: chromosomal replication initiator protein DnaA [Phycisphaerae bacterium]|nr:chromosomal replication initiator protein DnaA [Phycisphaerae bacterium]